MVIQDPLSDLLVRLRNAQAVKKETVFIPYSSLVWEAAKVLEREGYILKIDRRGKRARRVIEAALSYDTHGAGKISGAKRVSKLSQRVYMKARELNSVRKGYGMRVVSTPKGLMTDKEARKGRVGGEVLFEIW